ncbi:MAG: DUF952 domain-containing protein [Hyphomicrobiaceae bacterium]|nr:DUF952 domain-containing protein [Hyphomicrobiaceae bacterium]
MSALVTDGPDRLVYKILGEAHWQDALRQGAFAGSVDDKRDGFIHLSAAEQLAETAARHFRGRPGLLLVAFRSGDLGDRLIWETSRGGALFPHLYGSLPTGLAVRVAPMPLDADGVPVVPEWVA